MLDFGEDEDRESEISLGLNGEPREGGGNLEDVGNESEEDEARTQYAKSSPRRAESAEVPSLPVGWARRTSRKGEIYYLNMLTNESTWDAPLKAVEPPQDGGGNRGKVQSDDVALRPKETVVGLANADAEQGREDLEVDIDIDTEKGTSCSTGLAENSARLEAPVDFHEPAFHPYARNKSPNRQSPPNGSISNSYSHMLAICFFPLSNRFTITYSLGHGSRKTRCESTRCRSVE